MATNIFNGLNGNICQHFNVQYEKKALNNIYRNGKQLF